MSAYSPYAAQPENYASPPLTIILIVTLLIFFFAGFLSIYVCRCFMQNIIHTLRLRNSPSGNLVATTTTTTTTTTNHGLDPSLIQAFPTFAYSTVKDFRREKYGLECAICLAEFENDSMLRLLTVCYHVFHQECIDLWLESHKTCPVCRTDLDLPEKPLEKSPVLVRSNSVNNISDNGSILEDAISIYIKEDDNDNDNDNEQGRRERDEQGGGAGNNIHLKQNETWHQKLEKFSRSHSTGHSILRIKKEDDKHTLRLPDHVKIKLLRGHHNGTGSCIPFSDYSRNGVSAEVGECSGGDIDKI